MNNKKFFMSVSGVAILLIILLPKPLSHDLNAQPLRSPLFTWGEIGFEFMFDKAPVLHPNFDLFIDGSPVTNAVVRIDDRYSVPHTGGGTYATTIAGYPEDTNKLIEITVRSRFPISASPTI